MQERFGRYEVVRHLARGGMAEVLLARLEGHGGFRRPVVIKRILPFYANDRAFVDMFLDEARIAASIRHPNVVHVEDLGLEQGEPYIVMEYLAGESVAALLERMRTRREPPELRLAIHVVSETLAGLHAAHELTGPDGKKRGIVHRDVSPQNVMLTYDGHVKVLDFGIARAEGRLAKTSTGEIKGKVSYMSPEHCRGEAHDARSVVFAAGVMLYELITLRHPFRQQDEAATLMALVSGEYPKLAGEAGELDAELGQILAQSLTVAKTARYRTAADMRRDLAKLVRALVGDDSMETILSARMEQLFADHQGGPECLSFDHACHGDAVGAMHAMAAPLALALLVVAVHHGLFNSRWYAMFHARGPPSVR
jgi:serine/threonine-protein kinase